ncbi:hypothetical protein PUR61_05165 [Streptomyces sp. BE20]|uniref:hypothetical protein n=1 Tax=Streptomyces sp. BE20 TaxID=3002525 RepID=UPI002E7A006C|nr:hypothetical protein [Streptomyces sp. BE20]MEE1821587.1 hypothetical protein [Streptomyces sp. BE20]
MRFAYSIQASLDAGKTWKDHAADPHGTKESEDTAARLASDLLDTAYRSRLDADGSEPIGLLRSFVWEGPHPQGPPAATASTGSDTQWDSLQKLLSEIADDLARFEQEKREADEAAAAAQTAIINARSRLEAVALSGAQANMPQVMIAHGARRSREWVRRLQDDQGGDQSQTAHLRAAVREEGGTWNAQRATEALRGAGHDVDQKGARALLRKLAAEGAIAKAHPTSAIYKPAGT